MRRLSLLVCVLAVLAGAVAPPIAAAAGEPASTMTSQERRFAYEMLDFINAERRARDLTEVTAYADWQLAVDELAGKGRDTAEYWDRGFASRLRITSGHGLQQGSSGAVVARLMQTEYTRQSVLSPEIDYVAIGIDCTDETYVRFVIHWLASTSDIVTGEDGEWPDEPIVTPEADGTWCSALGGHPSPVQGHDPFAGVPRPGGRVVVERAWGPDRIATAVEVSRRIFPTSEARVPTVVLATGDNFPDALAAGPVAAKLQAPLLLTWRTRLPEGTLQELYRLAPHRIVLVGGRAAIGDEIISEIRQHAHIPVVRWAGSDRVGTAAEVTRQGWPTAETVYIAPAETHHAALVAGVPAGQRGSPLLLAWRNRLPDETAAELRRLAPKHVVVVGGPDVISDAVVAAVQRSTPVAVQHRISGTAPWALSAEGAARTHGVTDTVYLATADKYPDALAASPLAVARGGRLLLVPSAGRVSHDVLLAAAEHCPSRLVVVGGTGAVPDQVVGQVSSQVRTSCGD